MKLLESRRLTGHSLLQEKEGAVLEVALAPGEADAVIRAWSEQARALLAAVGWGDEEVTVRRFSSGASFGISAPIDALYAATEVNEEAWRAAEAVLRGEAPPDPHAVAASLRRAIERERNPALLTLREAAEARGVAFLHDDEQVTVGLGAGSLSWPVEEIPPPGQIPWESIHDIPVVLVTGTNGKTTTVRLLAAMGRISGLVTGSTTTDRVEVMGEMIEEGDFSGPGGARTLLRDRRVELAILETARGGLLRRGLAIRHAEAAAVTNIAADHLGELGVENVGALADAKMVVARMLGPEGRLILNGDDPLLVARAGSSPAPVVWFSLDPERPSFQALLRDETTAWVLHGSEIERWHGGWKQTLAHVDEIPITFGGAARYNVANALSALALGAAIRLPDEAMLRALRHVEGSAEDNPGRGNLFELGGARILLDYAHNPHGVAAVIDLAVNLPARRRLILLGQAGDRDDDSLRELAQTAWRFRPDRIVLKEIPELLRGRPAGEVTAVLEDELRRLGVDRAVLDRAPNELEAVREALAWARPGDLLLLLVHKQRDEVLALLGQLRGARWEAGQPLP